MFFWLQTIETFFWGFLGFFFILLLGVYFTWKTKAYQLRSLPKIIATFWQAKAGPKEGIHPVKALFASVGGMVGIGNLVGIVTAVQLGGPGALFWVWFAGILGSLIKYGEVFLGLKFRKDLAGGPMYVIPKAFPYPFLGSLACALLCLYGVEIYQFNVVSETLSSNFGWNKEIVIAGLLSAALFVVYGGIKRVAQISSVFLPYFILIYFVLGIWVLLASHAVWGEVLRSVIVSAFTGHAAIGAFAGSSVMIAIQQGIARAAYSADIGIGNDAIIHSTSSTSDPKVQARLALFGVLLDNAICTLTLAIVLCTGVWQEPIHASQMVQEALSRHFPYMDLFIPLFIAILGFTTIIAYLSVGITCATWLFPKRGKKIYMGYAVVAFPLFCFVDQTHTLLVMSFAGAALLCLNLSSLFSLRKEIDFFDKTPS